MVNFSLQSVYGIALLLIYLKINLSVTGNPSCDSGYIENCTSCDPGTYANESGVDCYCCQVFGQCKIDSLCVPCARGYYNPASQKTSCVPCEKGHYANVTGKQECDGCEAGYITNKTGSFECQPCAEGEFQNKTKQSSCNKCDPGGYQNRTGQEECLKCDTGHFSNQQASTGCTACTEGEYQNITGQANCLKCSPGYFQDQKAQAECSMCKIGTFSKEEGSPKCEDCPKGEFQNVTGQPSCDKCHPGSYQNATGKSLCEPCQITHYCKIFGCHDCKPCPAGTYGNQTGLVECLACPAGSYSPSTPSGVTQCTECQNGHHNDKKNQSSCVTCDSGTVCKMPQKKQYLQESLDKAIGAVNANKLSISKAATEYGVPRTTISDHVNGKYDNHLNGPSKMLTDEEETSLINYVKYMAERGFPLTRRMLKAFVISIIEKSGRSTLFNMEKGPSNKWVNKLLNRHPELSEKLPEQQDKARRRMSNITVVDQYFKLLVDTVDSLGLTNKPNQIFNCDESGFSGKEKSKEKVLTLKGSHSYQQKVLVHGHITVHMCIAADGHVLPSFLIFDGCLPHRSFKDGVPDNWLYGSSESGYMDTELFENWFDKVFIPFCGTRRPVLLIFDNHDSHISIDLIEKAKANNIHIIGLPPHTTHLLQPLDVAIFGPLKEKVNQLSVTLGNLNKCATIGKAKFPALLSTAIDQTTTLARVKESFRKSGMYPVDRSIIPNSQLAPADFNKSEKTNKETTDVDTTTITNNELQESTILCHCCGNTISYVKEIEMSINEPTENPLVTKNLIPKSLADVLLPPANPSLAKKTSSKIITEARVITGDEMLQKLQSKRDEAVKLAEEKEERKTERARKKEEAEVLKEAKKEERERKKRDREIRDTEKEEERERKRQKKEEKRNMQQCNQQITAEFHQHATCTKSSVDMVDNRRSTRVKTPLIREEFLQFDSDMEIIETMEE